MAKGKYFTPKEIVTQLDKYVVGQKNAKRSVAIAMRNRWRRQQVPEELRDEIAPKNIIMIGPTGVGKTEIARRLAKLAQAPFLKIEVTKFTEVGYVGRDVESIIRDLTELAINMLRAEETEKVQPKAQELAEERMLDLLLPAKKIANEKERGKNYEAETLEEAHNYTREKLRKMLREGRLEDRFVEMELTERNFPIVEIFSSVGMEEMDINIRDMFGNFFPKKTKRSKMKVSEAKQILLQEEAQKLVDMENITKEAIKKVEQSGIVFLDEIDKIASRGYTHGPDVSREGVQRDILPIVEGTTVMTKYGMVKTDHILFIAAGAFHMSKPSDLIPELQGRFPIRVELDSLGKEEFVRILTEPKNALVKQYKALLKTEGIDIEFTEETIANIAEIAAHVNERTENIGARRLHTVMEKLLNDISFEAPTLETKEIIIDAEYVNKQLGELVKDEDLSRYIL